MIAFAQKVLPLSIFLLLLIACASEPTTEQTNPADASAPIATTVPAPTTAAPAAVEEEVAKDSSEAVADEPAAVVAQEEQEEEQKEEKPKAKRKVKKRPKMVFAAAKYDFGTIMQGDKVEHQFTFTNEGKADLQISNVSASCGCTQPSFPFLPIAPGEKGTIGVVFDSKGKLGRQIPTITVVTNARPTTYQLKLEGFVDAERAKEQTTEPTPEEESPTPVSEEEG